MVETLQSFTFRFTSVIYRTAFLALILAGLLLPLYGYAQGCSKNLTIQGEKYPCPGTTYTYRPVLSKPGNCYWSLTGGKVIRTGGDSISIEWDERSFERRLTVYTYDWSKGCYDEGTQYFDRPVLTLTGTRNQSLCSHDPAWYSVSGQGQSDSVEWVVTGGAIAYASADSSQIKVIWDTMEVAGAIAVRLKNRTACTEDTSLARHYKLYPCGMPSQKTSYGPACYGDTLQLKAGSQETGMKYTWYDFTWGSYKMYQTDPQIKYYIFGDARIRVVKTNAYGCQSADTFLIKGQPFGHTAVDGNFGACIGRREMYTITGVPQGPLYYQVKGGKILNIWEGKLEVQWTEAGHDTLILTDGQCYKKWLVNIYDTAFRIEGPKDICINEWNEFKLITSPKGEPVFTIAMDTTKGEYYYADPQTIRVRVKEQVMFKLQAMRPTYAGLCGSVNEYLIVNTILPPVSAFRYSQGCTDSTVQFTNRSRNAAYYIWDFGDGSPAVMDKDPVHYYSKPGYYIAQLTSITVKGCRHTSFQLVACLPYQKAAIAWKTKRSGPDGLTVTFIADDTYLPDPIWYFGDGDSSHGARVQHTYTQTGNYAIKLKGMTHRGCPVSADSTLVLDSMTGISMIGQIQPLDMYPNPTYDLVNIRLPEDIRSRSIQYTILDLSGREVLKGTLPPAPLRQISLTDLPPGIYQLQLQAEAQFWQQRVVKLNP